MSLSARLRGLFWQYSHLWRQPGRRLKRSLALLNYRRRVRLGSGEPPRVVFVAPGIKTKGQSTPNLGLRPITMHIRDGDETDWAQLGEQTAKDWIGIGEVSESRFFFAPGNSPFNTFPPTLLESLLLAMTAENGLWAIGGYAPPAEGAHGPSGALWDIDSTSESNAASAPLLLRLPAPQPLTSLAPATLAPLLGRAVPHITEKVAQVSSLSSPEMPVSLPLAVGAGAHHLHAETSGGQVVTAEIYDVSSALASLPTLEDSPSSDPMRTALFLLPFLAVGGAERLLFDLLAGLEQKYRLLVVTLEPHRASLGQTVDRCRELTPHVYTLGDWLPRETHAGALHHLLRLYGVETLVSWNGTVAFFDLFRDLKQSFSNLRICNQLYNHEGGWIDRTSPQLIRHVDLHLAINQPIADALEARGVPSAKVAVVHHGVEVPAPMDAQGKKAQREASRRSLGLPQDALVVGTFIRLHPQKRPMDILQLAERFASSDVYFLLAGGGPLEQELDRRLAKRPLENLLRLPWRRDLDHLYAAVDVCLLTSAYEGLPIFLLDGLAREIPCVAPAVGEIPRLVADGGGFLVQQPGDLEGLATAIDRLRDAAVRREQGARGRQTVERLFGLDTYRRTYEELIFPPGSSPQQNSVSTPRSCITPKEASEEAAKTVADKVSAVKTTLGDSFPAIAGRRPKASVVIPSYNHGPYIEAAVESVLQTDADLELVVIDDGSRDDSPQRLQAMKNSRLHLELQENQGAHQALNLGLQRSRGDIIFILNSDDLYDPQRIPLFLDLMEREPSIALLASWLRIIDGDGKPLGTKEAWQNMPPWPLPGPGPSLADLGVPALALLQANFIATTSNVAFWRRDYQQHQWRFLPLRYTHDWDFFLHACRRDSAGQGRLHIVEEPLVSYRVHSHNTIGEGAGQRAGEMSFEILWTLARHAFRLCREWEKEDYDRQDLSDRLWSSMPCFGRRDILAQLLMLRGKSVAIPTAYDRLLDPQHPYRVRAIDALTVAAAAESPSSNEKVLHEF